MTENTDLSDREREILILVATGKSNKEIAQQLFISANTVKVHLRNIFSKVGAASRTEAAMFAVNAGILPSSAQEEDIRGEEAKDDGVVEAGAASIGTASIGAASIGAANDGIDILQESEPGRTGDSNPPLANTAESQAVLQTTIPGTESAALASGETAGMSKTRRTPWLVPGLVVLVLVFVVLGGILTRYLAGQANNDNVSVQTVSPRWKILAEMPTPRFAFAVAAVENQIYTIAGEGVDDTSAVVERYNPATNTWDRLADKPTPVSEVRAATLGGKVYVPGGKLEGGRLTDLLEVYDPDQDRWETAARLPQPVSAYALSAFEGRLYLVGGWDGHEFLSQVYEYNPSADLWNKLPDMPTPRGYAGTCTMGDRIYVLGGRDLDNPVSANEILNPVGEGYLWSEAAPLPTGRYGMGVACVADAIHLIGGVGLGSASFSTMQYFPSTDSWKVYESSLEQPVSDMAVIAVDAYLYAIGGRSNEVVTGRNQAYQVIFTVAIPLVR